MKSGEPRGSPVTWLDDYVPTARSVARAADELVEELRGRKGDVVVNVHGHAWPAHEAFLRRYYSDGRPRVVALSMNPARNGAVQSGIAFTDAPTARVLLRDFDALVERPPRLRTERSEMSGQKLRQWAERSLGGLPGLYRRVLFPIACPVAVLRGPRLLNVPLATLSGPERRLADRFYETHAPRLVRAARPTGLLLLGSYAAERWRRVEESTTDLASLPHAVTHHPAARMPNDKKWADWTAALKRLEQADQGPGAVAAVSLRGSK